ncbi:hypothetical protein [Stutzerimonas xanthomarina]|uniref:primase 1D-like protein n=1 Tax=Stutzerimonas xanthomarina TaxID=271420 RepID=UPI003AA922A8
MKMVEASHPYWHVRSMAERYSKVIDSFNFSYYTYIPQSLNDSREIFSLTLTQLLDVRVVASMLSTVPSGCELAVHSLIVLRDGGSAHIPMADMSSLSLAKLTKYRIYLDSAHGQKFSWYKSGRSFHGYGDALIDTAGWSAYMGKLLLANEPGMPPVVDPRWVGHRLIAGYAALRWTKNTEQYKEVPKQQAADVWV